MGAVAEVAFVDGRQQGIKDSRAGFPDFIQEDNFRFWQIACR